MADRAAATPGRRDPVPPPAEHFVGRDAELALLRREIGRDGLRDPDAPADAGARPRILVVAGAPGSGRTALAVRLARELAAELPDGLLHARLTDPDGDPVPPEHAAVRLLELLGAPLPVGVDETLPWDDEPEPAGPACALLRATLGTRRAVLLLDDAADSEQLRALLPDGDACLVIATVRGPLTGIRDARPVILGGLDRPAALELLGRHVDDSRLVVDPTAAHRLAELCGARPAALRLIGRWLAARPQAPVTEALRRLGSVPVEDAPPAEPAPAPPPRPAADTPDMHWVRDAGILDDPAGAEQVEFDRGDSFAPQSREAAAEAAEAEDAGPAPAHTPAPASDDAPPPAEKRRRAAAAAREAESGDPLQRCLAVVQQDLTPSLARLLRLLVLVPDGVVTAHFASALTGYHLKSAASGLIALADAGLLERQDTGPVPPPPVEARYRMPGWLQPAARERLRRLERPADIELALARMLERTARLLAACQAVLLPPPDGAPRPQIAPDVRFHSRAQAREWLRGELPVLMSAVHRAVGEGGLDTLARRLATALVRLLDTGAAGDAPGARRVERYRLHGHMLELARRRGDFAQFGAALTNLGRLDATAGRRELALHRYRSALDAVRRDPAGAGPGAEGHILELIARTHLDLGDPARAADWYRRALALHRSRGELADQARLLGSLAAVAAGRGDLDGALRDLRSRTRLHRRLGDPVRLARGRLDIAALHLRAGRLDEALDASREAITEARALADGRLEQAGLERAAEVLRAGGDEAGARLHEQRAEELARQRAADVRAGAHGRCTPLTPPRHTCETQEKSGIES